MKLKRLRDQTKTWIASAHIKETTSLLDNRWPKETVSAEQQENSHRTG